MIEKDVINLTKSTGVSVDWADAHSATTARCQENYVNKKKSHFINQDITSRHGFYLIIIRNLDMTSSLICNKKVYLLSRVKLQNKS